MAQLTSTEYLRASPDPIAPRSRELFDYINSTYSSKFAQLCKEGSDLDIDEAFMFEADQYGQMILFILILHKGLYVFRNGFTLLGKRPEEGWFEFRFPFDTVFHDYQSYKAQMDQVFHDLGRKSNKDSWGAVPEFQQPIAKGPQQKKQPNPQSNNQTSSKSPHTDDVDF